MSSYRSSHATNLELAQTSLDKHLKQCAPNPVTSLDWSMQIGEGIFVIFLPEEMRIYGILFYRYEIPSLWCTSCYSTWRFEVLKWYVMDKK